MVMSDNKKLEEGNPEIRVATPEVRVTLSPIGVRLVKLGYIFLSVILIFFFFPFNKVLYLSSGVISFSDFIFRATQKLFFLGISAALLFQFRSLLADLLEQRTFHIGNYEISNLELTGKSEPTLTESDDIEFVPDSFDVEKLDYEKVFRRFRGRMKGEARRLRSI
jgi:hypothetical protein